MDLWGRVLEGDKRAHVSRVRVYHGLGQIGYSLQTFEQRCVKCACHPSTMETGWRIVHKLELSLGYVARLCLKSNHNKPKQQKSLKQRTKAEERCGHVGGPSGKQVSAPDLPKTKSSRSAWFPVPFPRWAAASLVLRQIFRHSCPSWPLPMLSVTCSACPSTVPFLRFTSCLVCKTSNQYAPQKVVVRMNWISRRIADRGSGPQFPNLYMEGDSSLCRKVETV